MTSCRNEHSHNTCTCTVRKMAFFITYQDHQTQVVAADAITITIMSHCFCL